MSAICSCPACKLLRGEVLDSNERAALVVNATSAGRSYDDAAALLQRFIDDPPEG